MLSTDLALSVQLCVQRDGKLGVTELVARVRPCQVRRVCIVSSSEQSAGEASWSKFDVIDLSHNQLSSIDRHVFIGPIKIVRYVHHQSLCNLDKAQHSRRSCSVRLEVEATPLRSRLPIFG